MRPKWMTDDELADYFGIPRSLVLDKTRRGEWSFYEIGGHRVFLVSDIVKRVFGINDKGDDDENPRDVQ